MSLLGFGAAHNIQFTVTAPSSGGVERSLESASSPGSQLIPSLEDLHNRFEQLLAMHGRHTIRRDGQCDLNVTTPRARAHTITDAHVRMHSLTHAHARTHTHVHAHARTQKHTDAHTRARAGSNFID